MKIPLLCICVFLFSPLLAAQEQAEEPATDYLISPDERGEDNLKRIGKNQPQDAQISPRQYLSAIEEIEADYGAYDLQLSQHLSGLGVQYQAIGEHQEAIEVFKRAMHIQRVNLGLYDMGQIPILENIIESQIALGEWEDANERYQYLYWLHRRNYGNDDPRMLPIINKLSDWHLQAYALNVSGGLFHHLLAAHNLYQIAVDLVGTTYGANDLRMIDPLRGLTASNYFLATYQEENHNKLAVQNGSMPATEDERARLQAYISRSFDNGRSAINRMVHVYSNNPEATPADEIRAQVALADWYLLFGKWHSAMDLYRDAYQRATTVDGDANLEAELFGRPVALPDMPLIDLDQTDSINTNNYVLAQFNVNAYGRVTNIDILETSPADDSRMKSRVRRTLKAAKFRPQFKDGEAVTTKDITHRYLFSDKSS